MQPRKLINKHKNTKTNKLVPNSGVSYLNLMAMGESSQNIAQLLSSLIASYNCNIINTKITEFGQDLVLSALINGKWNEIIKLEKSLSNLIKKYPPIQIYTKRNNSIAIFHPSEPSQPHINYVVQATAVDRPGLLNKLLQFFSRENIAVTEVNIYPRNNNVHLINIEIHIKIPANVHIISFRETFLTYCDVLNLDTSLEPA